MHLRETGSTVAPGGSSDQPGLVRGPSCLLCTAEEEPEVVAAQVPIRRRNAASPTPMASSHLLPTQLSMRCWLLVSLLDLQICWQIYMPCPTEAKI
uniref:Uncharacterized protein n=1 Tax=Arundo donax TaxID=35708 RepID=A0A0A9EPH0_ARUDO